MSAGPARTALPLVLASASPRRVDILREAAYEFRQSPADIDESRLPGEAPERYVLRLAAAKARAVWRAGTMTLGADTIVVVGDEVLGKPRDRAHARRMLRCLSASFHFVMTGVAVFDGRRSRTRCETTRVWFRDLSEREIGDYVATGEPLDKAGAYAIQGGAAGFVERIEGSYRNVVGLPLEAVATMLR